MLSILIPTYNFDIRRLIFDLHEQAEKEEIKFEIIVADDASDHAFRHINKETEILYNVKYIQLNKNSGRSEIRNFLAKQAKYNYLLFIDCDMMIENSNFIHNYLLHAKDSSVICGGINYSTEPPENQKFFFRWYYGIHREKSSAKKRSLNPYASFMTGNFFINKDIFKSIKFNEQLKEYGHEDTLFGIELKRKNINITHIENTLIHNGLETIKVFISKTEKGIDNLIFLTDNFDYPELFENIKLLRAAKKLRLLKPLFLISLNIFTPLLIKNSDNKKLKLFLFDFYKLGYYFKKNNS